MDKIAGVLGIGNLLLGDEGFGVHFVDNLLKNYNIPENIDILDGGTAGIMLSPFIEQVNVLYVIDVVNMEGPPGSIHRFTDRDVRSGNIQTRMSPHQVGLLEILDLCRLRDHFPEHIEMLTVIPEDMSTRIGLSPCLTQSLPIVTDMLVHALKKHNFSLSTKTPEYCE